MKIIKFGGTSVSSAQSLTNILNIVQDNIKQQHNIIVVCSALQNVTDILIQTYHLMLQGNNKYKKLVANIQQQHQTLIEQIIELPQQPPIVQEVNTIFDNLYQILHQYYAIKYHTDEIEALISGFGEILSCTIISHYLTQHQMTVKFVNARNLITTEINVENMHIVNFPMTEKNICKWYETVDYIPIVTGFIASTTTHTPSILGRGGSDYTAAILGASLNASSIEIWTDVDGIMTIDPIYSKDGYSIPYISYREAIELSHSGAKVIYLPTIYPTYKKDIPILIKNTFNPAHPGTLVTSKPFSRQSDATGISVIKDITLMIIEYSAMHVLTLCFGNILNKLVQNNINVLLTTHMLAENSTCIIVAENDAKLAYDIIKYHFIHEINLEQITKINMLHDHSLISLVGENLQDTPGSAGKFLSGLGHNQINISAIIQSPAKLNISVIIQRQNLQKAINVTHKLFFIKA